MLLGFMAFLVENFADFVEPLNLEFGLSMSISM